MKKEYMTPETELIVLRNDDCGGNGNVNGRTDA